MTAEATQLEQRIQDNQGLVISLAKSIHRKLPPQIGMDDLIAYGQLGLAEAAQSFRTTKGQVSRRLRIIVFAVPSTTVSRR